MSDPGAPETAPDGFIPVASRNPFGALVGPPYENVEGDRFWVQGTSPVRSATGIFRRIRGLA